MKRILHKTYGGQKMSLFAYETAFAVISNDLNNLPLCLGSRYENLERADLITPSRLLLGRNNRRAPTGYPLVMDKSKWISEMTDVYKSWWAAWAAEALERYTAKPKKWFKSGPELEVGDIVVFLKTAAEAAFNKGIWRLGEISAVERSADGIVRKCSIKYRNPEEKTFRYTRRPVRSVAKLFRESELELNQQLDLARHQSLGNI